MRYDKRPNEALQSYLNKSACLRKCIHLTPNEKYQHNIIQLLTFFIIKEAALLQLTK